MSEPSNTNEINTENPPEVVIDAQEEPDIEHIPYISIIEDFKYAPPKPDGDPWEILWKSRMDKEKLRCDAWKDEVQNLLIFAGLFSAVVTAFIVESYKTLQADPNDAIINLLSTIATRLDGSVNSTTSTVAHSFSPTPSSIRVNIFWFISLILSLTTVLVGIIGLQWLREHLSYSGDLKPREKYALCVMRADGFKTWQVDKIFTSLPLLLQSALILFFGGVIDFLHTFGHWTVVIPVTIAVGMTLIFLVATTILPWLQVTLLVFVSFSKDPPTDYWERQQFLGLNKPPSRCPYKSPQSRAVGSIWLVLLKMINSLKSPYDLGRHGPRFLMSWMHPEEDTPKSHFLQCISQGSQFTTWRNFDLTWLCIRDGYMRSLLKCSSSYDYYWSHKNIPFYDLVQGLIHERGHETHFPSAYHCFSELSELALQPMISRGKFTGLADFCRQSAYLHEFLQSEKNTLLPNYLSSQYTSDGISTTNFMEIAKTLTTPLHQQNLESFIPYSTEIKLPLKLHLLNYFFQTRNVTPSTQIQPQESASHCLILGPIDVFLSLKYWKNDTEYPVFFEETAGLTQIILRQTAESSNPNYAAYHPSVQSRVLPCFLESSGLCAASVLGYKSRAESLDTIKDKYHSIFDFIKEQLDHEMDSWTTASCRPSLLFYTSSIFVHYAVAGWHVVWERPPDWVDADISFRSMCSTIHTYYRQSTIDKGIIDSDIQERLRQGCERIYYEAFSNEWWDELIKHKLPEEPPHHSSSPPSSPTVETDIGTQP